MCVWCTFVKFKYLPTGSYFSDSLRQLVSIPRDNVFLKVRYIVNHIRSDQDPNPNRSVFNPFIPLALQPKFLALSHSHKQQARSRIRWQEYIKSLLDPKFVENYPYWFDSSAYSVRDVPAHPYNDWLPSGSGKSSSAVVPDDSQQDSLSNET